MYLISSSLKPFEFYSYEEYAIQKLHEIKFWIDNRGFGILIENRYEVF